MSQFLNQAGTTQTLPLTNVLSRGFESSTAEQTRPGNALDRVHKGGADRLG